MISSHATSRAIERIKNKSIKKNKKANIKKIMRKDVSQRYFAYANNSSTIFRYVSKNNQIYKYVLNVLNKKIITVYKVDFKEELKKHRNIRYVREKI